MSSSIVVFPGQVNLLFVSHFGSSRRFNNSIPMLIFALDSKVGIDLLISFCIDVGR